jgi:hypothetical protein
LYNACARQRGCAVCDDNMRTASRALGGCALRRYLSEERHLRRVFDGAYTTCALLYCAARSARFARCIALAAISSISPARRGAGRCGGGGNGG